MKKLFKFAGLAALLPGALLLTGCDDTYDLSKDLDLTVQLGGDHLTLPSSSTDKYTMAQILDIENSSIIMTAANGDCSIVKDGDRTESTVKIDDVKLDDINNQEDHAKNTPLPKGPFNSGEMVEIHMVGENPSLDDRYNRYIKKLNNKIDLNSSDVTNDLISVSKVYTDVDVDVILEFLFQDYTGNVIVKQGYTITFSDDMVVSCHDAVMSQYIEVVGGHQLRFKKDYVATKAIAGKPSSRTFTIPVSVDQISFSGANPITKTASGKQTFKFQANVVSTGVLEIEASKLPSDKEDSLDIASYTNVIGDPFIGKVVGKVDPKINVDSSSFDISDVPEFLRSGDNNLDLSDPQMYLAIDNSSPVQALLCIEFTSIDENGTHVDLNVGDRAKNDYPIAVEPGMNYICLSNLPVSDADICTNLGVTPGSGKVQNITKYDIGSLLNTIPEKVLVEPYAKANTSVDYTFELGTEYKFNSDSKVIVPLAFGKNLHIDYTDKTDDWDSDLHKFNFKKAVINMEAVNTIPMDLDFNASPIFINNEDGAHGEIKVEVEKGKIAGAPSVGTPATSQLVINLESVGANLNGLDGIEFNVIGSSTDALAGVCLNENQYIKFDSIKITIEGGITIDLNKDKDE